jgi:hypothetical protein
VASGVRGTVRPHSQPHAGDEIPPRYMQISVETEHRTDEAETKIVGFTFSLEPIGCNLSQNRSSPQPNNRTELSV